MSKMIQIRNVPERLHRTLKVRAAQEGMTLSDYLIRELRQLTQVPTLEEFLDRLPNYDDVLSPDPAELIRAARDSRSGGKRRKK